MCIHLNLLIRVGIGLHTHGAFWDHSLKAWIMVALSQKMISLLTHKARHWLVQYLLLLNDGYILGLRSNHLGLRVQVPKILLINRGQNKILRVVRRQHAYFLGWKCVASSYLRCMVDLTFWRFATSISIFGYRNRRLFGLFKFDVLIRIRTEAGIEDVHHVIVAAAVSADVRQLVHFLVLCLRLEFQILYLSISLLVAIYRVFVLITMKRRHGYNGVVCKLVVGNATAACC